MKEIDWANLSFGYMKTDYNVRINFRNGAWGELEISSSEVLNLHMAATCLHYGQEAFEGLKAFRGKDGKVRIFRLEENAARLHHKSVYSCQTALPILTGNKIIRIIITMYITCLYNFQLHYFFLCRN